MSSPGRSRREKSSLLNALFGRDFCRVDVLPATDRINVFKYGEEAHDVPVSPSLVERYQPVPFLRDFNIVDTPGTNTIVADHQTITEQFVPQADLIVFVFSVVNPWGASAWQFLELLQKRWLKNVIFVLQQMDLREPGEVDAIVQHLRQTAMTRCGQAFPIFAVAAKKAFLSKTSGVDKERLWQESHFGPLEDYINEAVGAAEVRRSKLKRRRANGAGRAQGPRRAGARQPEDHRGRPGATPAAAGHDREHAQAHRSPDRGIPARHRHGVCARRAEGRADLGAKSSSSGSR